jgi:hypothetical protein
MMPSNRMERVSSLIARMRLGDAIDPQDLAVHAWAGAVGKRIAGHTHPVRLLGTTLIVELEDAVWERQLSALTPQILRNIGKSIGAGRVERIQFHLRPQRRGPQRAARGRDEADEIEDPVLRGIYRAARNRALA